MDSINEQVKAKFHQQQIQRYVETISSIAPVRVIAHSAPASVFMQFALMHTYVSRRAAVERDGGIKTSRALFVS